MIVLDEEIHGPSIAKPITMWYAGRVISIVALRPRSVVKDDAVPKLLRLVPGPTFVTINISDFWRKIPADSRYAVVCVDVGAGQVLLIPELLRHLFRASAWKTKADRMGKVARVRPGRIGYYEADGRIRSLAWPE